MSKMVSRIKQEMFVNRVVEVLKYVVTGLVLLACFVGSAWQW